MKQLQVVSFALVHDTTMARSFYRVQLADGAAPEYDPFSSIRARSLAHAYNAEKNPGAYRFYDDDGVLEIQPAQAADQQPKEHAIPLLTQEQKEQEVKKVILTLLDLLETNKPNDRSDKDRLWAIVRTDAQKLLAFWRYMEESGA